VSTQDPENRTAISEDGIEAVVPGARFDPWSYREDVEATGADLAGYRVEAVDGGVGKVGSWTQEVSAGHLVVATGPWIFGRKVMVPAGAVNHIDHVDQRIYLDQTKEQIKAAPEFDPRAHTTPEYRDKVAAYYRDTYGVPDAAGGIFPPGAVPPGGLVPPAG
jgi:hypothetical protein